MAVEAAIWEAMRVLVLFVLPLTAVVGIASIVASTVGVFIGVRDPVVGYVVRLAAAVGVAIIGGAIVIQALFDMTIDLMG